MPPLTVLMSVHNGLPYLTAAIESILAQSYRDFDFLIIDDASEDDSAVVIHSYASKDRRIRMITNLTKLGLGAALNLGVSEATSPLVARMDADDIAMPNRLEAQMMYMQSHPSTAVLGTWAHDIDDDSKIVGERRVPVHCRDITRLVWANPFVHSSVMLNRALILEAGSYDPTLAKRQDYDLWFRCVAHQYALANLPHYFMQYRLTNATYKRNRWRIARTHLMIGWRGCRLVNAPPVAYLGVAAPVVKSIVPPALGPTVHGLLKKIDPRQTKDS